MFVTFEGLDGSGKTTALASLKKYLKTLNIDFILTREPGNYQTPLSQKIREILVTDQTISPMAEAILFAADRRIHLEQVVWPALKQEKLILCDRYFDSSFAYQGYGRKLGLKKIVKLNEAISENTYPDLTIYFKLPIEVAIKRVQERKKQNRLDQENQNFIERVHQGYDHLAKLYSQRYRIINAEASFEEVFNQVKAIFEHEVLPQLKKEQAI